uniref:GDP-Man:Man(3)GlcNAc(2)-PP-Dol alpha-1,2-mannosyltransferase n=1 Tax=Trichuris muris TaxID=70415 RepID=A0A5S6QIW8_TRIMR
MLLPFISFGTVGVSLLIAAIVNFLFIRFRRKTPVGKSRVAFFHPNCNAGGGGERVLWCAISALQRRNLAECYVYSGEKESTPEEITKNAEKRFNISLTEKVHFVKLKLSPLLNPSIYPRLTLLCQSIASFIVGLEALWRFQPDVFIETTGYAPTLCVFRLLLGCRTASYIHYPTISTDMLQMVAEQRPSYNNDVRVTNAKVLTQAKLLYYKALAKCYGWLGRISTDAIMVNSSWTKGHIVELWRKPDSTDLVFPPCDFAELSLLPLEREQDQQLNIVSVGQFRPEKDYPLTLRSFQQLLNRISDPSLRRRVRLIMIGSCRGKDDQLFLEDLRSTASQLAIDSQTDWKVNVPYEDLQESLGNAIAGIHTMWNEHFGIAIVEMMAAGVIVVAHNSGGPKMDIVRPYNGEIVGFLASTEKEYAEALLKILLLSKSDRTRIQRAARKSTERFRTEIFEDKFLHIYQTRCVSQ